MPADSSLDDPFLDDPLSSADPRDLGARLREARSARGWTQQQASEALGVARTTVTAIEKGERRVRPEELLRLAELYGRKLSDLLRQGEPPLGLLRQLRDAVAAGPEIDMGESLEDLERLLADYVELERLGEAGPVPPASPGYRLGALEPELVAEEAAVAERYRLALGDGPVLNLRDVLEIENGLRVFYLDLPEPVRALYAFNDEQGGLLGVNRSLPAERRRATLAQVYGHFLADRYRPRVVIADRYERRPAAERFAEAFGRAFLLPGQGIRRRFHEMLRQRRGRGGVQPIAGDVYRLAHHFFVPIPMTAQRLEDLGLIPGGSRQRLDAEAEEFREIECFLGLPELPVDDEVLPARYRYLAVEAWQRGGLTEGQLASFLRLDRVAARRVAQRFGASSVDLTTPLASLGSS